MTTSDDWQEEIIRTFLGYLVHGGIEACEAMVRDLAGEAGMANAVSTEGQEVKHETIEGQNVLPLDEIRRNLEMADAVNRDTMLARARYSLALWLLETTKARQV